MDTTTSQQATCRCRCRCLGVAGRATNIQSTDPPPATKLKGHLTFAIVVMITNAESRFYTHIAARSVAIGD